MLLDLGRLPPRKNGRLTPNTPPTCILPDHLSRVWCGSRCLETGLDARLAKQEKPATTAAQASE
jgi:hypothetical protein